LMENMVIWSPKEKNRTISDHTQYNHMPIMCKTWKGHVPSPSWFLSTMSMALQTTPVQSQT
jgi:hypothetical protein